jgi:heme-degrading monooxygenase HmoA
VSSESGCGSSVRGEPDFQIEDADCYIGGWIENAKKPGMHVTKDDSIRVNKLPPVREVVMAVKILIKRRLPLDRAQDMVAISHQLRILAMHQDGYISGETLRRRENPEEFLVISTWRSFEDWQNWFNSGKRKELQSKFDILSGRETTYEVYHYGLAA